MKHQNTLKLEIQVAEELFL